MFGRKRTGGRRTSSPFALSEEKLLEMRPWFDARIDKAAPGSRKLAGALTMRALAGQAAGDFEGAFADADAAVAIGGLKPTMERQATMVLARAVIALERADRYEEVLERLGRVSIGRVDAATAQNLRIDRIQLLIQLGRPLEARALAHEVPLLVDPAHPNYRTALLARANILLDGGDPAGALDDVETAMDAGLDTDLAVEAANLGAYCVAVLGREDRIEQALAWANLACSPGIGADGPIGLARRETRAAVLTVAGRGGEAIPTLQEGLVFLEQNDAPDQSRAWSHAFLARAHLDVGSLDEARRHAQLADELAATEGTDLPVLDAVRHRLS